MPSPEANGHKSKTKRSMSSKESSLQRTRLSKAKVTALKKKETEYQHEIHNYDLMIAAKKREIIKKKGDKISNRVKDERLQTFHQRYTTDQKLRPSDRGMDCRLYTKMDINVWEYPEMRSWFNKDAPADVEARMVKITGADKAPYQTGYMLRL